jgi:glycosyltransferase involved in cell wall biosynthesis
MVGFGVGWIYRRCDLILAQSLSFIANISHYASERVRIEYFPAWTDEIFGQGLPVEPAVEIPSAPGVFTVLFAGNVGEAQDFPAILDAASLLRSHDDIRWVIVGDGRMAEWVRKEIRSRGLEDRVLMVGRHPLERMPAFFACADALLASLRADPIFALTIPGKIQSYLGAGLPLLVMLDGEGAQIVAAAQAGLVCAAGDSAALAAHVVNLARMDPSERRRMGEHGRRLSAEAFDRRTLINRLEGWLEELAARRRTPGAHP